MSKYLEGEMQHQREFGGGWGGGGQWSMLKCDEEKTVNRMKLQTGEVFIPIS